MVEGTKILIIDGDVDSRSRLKEVLRLSVKSEIEFRRTLSDDPSVIKLFAPFQYIFINSAFGKEKIVAFLKSLKAESPNSGPLVIVCLAADDKNVRLVAELYQSQIHGFICDPYSSEDVVRLMEVSREAATETVDQDQRNRRTAGFLLDDFMQHLDAVADRMFEGKSGGGYSGKELKETGATFRSQAQTFGEDEIARLLLAKFENAKTSKKASRQKGKKVKARHVNHPGVELLQIMKARNLSKERLAGALGLDIPSIDQLLSAQLDVNEEIAHDLARAVGESARYWRSMQEDYNKQKEEAARAAAKNLTVKKKE